jgi:hypothetical protein
MHDDDEKTTRECDLPGFTIRTFEGLPDSLVMDFGLDTMLPQPQRQVWPSDRQPDPMMLGMEDDD